MICILLCSNKCCGLFFVCCVCCVLCISCLMFVAGLFTLVNVSWMQQLKIYAKIKRQTRTETVKSETKRETRTERKTERKKRKKTTVQEATPVKINHRKARRTVNTATHKQLRRAVEAKPNLPYQRPCLGLCPSPLCRLCLLAVQAQKTKRNHMRQTHWCRWVRVRWLLTCQASC